MISSVESVTSYVGMMMSRVSSEPHQENKGSGSSLTRLFSRGQSPRFTNSSKSGRRTCKYVHEDHSLALKVKVSSYIAQYPILRIAQSALHFTSLADLLNQTPSQFLWEASSHMLQLICKDCSYTYPPLSIVWLLLVIQFEVFPRTNRLTVGYHFIWTFTDFK